MGNLQNWGNFDNSICVGHGSTGIVHGAYTEVTAEELARAMQVPSVEPVNVRARIMDMPDVQLKFAQEPTVADITTDAQTVQTVTEEIRFNGGGQFFQTTNDDVNVRARPATTTSEASTTQSNQVFETQTQEATFASGTIAQGLFNKYIVDTNVIATYTERSFLHFPNIIL